MFPLVFSQLVRFQIVFQSLLWVVGFPLLFSQSVKCQCVQLPVEGSLPPRGRWSPPPLQLLPIPPVSQSPVGQSFESLGETGPPACARETQRVPPIRRVVFVRPIVGRLEDLTTACLTTFNHSADTFELNNEDGSLRAVPHLYPPTAACH